MGADFTVAACEQLAQDVGGWRILRDRMSNHICGANGVLGKQRVQPRQGVDVLEPLVQPRCGIPLVVTLGIDSNEQIQHSAFSIQHFLPVLVGIAGA